MRPLVLVLLVLSMLAPSAPAADEAPRLLVRIANENAPAEVELALYDASDARVHSRVIALERGQNVVELAVEPATYLVELAMEDPQPSVFTRVFPGTARVGQYVAMEGCLGASAADFRVGADSIGTVASGCLVLSADAAALLEEARAARAGASRAAFEVPAPRDADRGVYGGTTFGWRGQSSFLDAWGRAVEGPELRYLDTGRSHYATSDVTGIEVEAEVATTVQSLLYLPGERAPHAWTSTVPGFGSADAPAAASVTIERELRYDEPWRLLPCAMRNGLQGRTLRSGDVVAAEDVCPRWPGPAWRAAAPVTIEGHRLLPLYQHEESAERILVARVYLLDGLPYPLAMERHVLPADGMLRSSAMRLERFEGAGAPLALHAPPAPEPPRAALSPIDPLRGPSLGPADSRLAFPLADAADAALADPTLRSLQSVLARPDAALLGAAYGVARDDGSPLTLLRWVLVYGASDAAPTFVQCERPDLALPVAPPARCRDAFEASGLADPLYGARPMGRDELPRAGASFADAIARWDATRDERGAPVTFAVYRAWSEDRAPLLAVGAGVPAPLTPADGEVGGSADHVALELATGRTLASVRVEQAGAALANAPLRAVGPSTLRAADAPFLDPASLPLVVAGGLGLALLALVGLLLYSRLVRSRVLDSAARAAIVDIVGAEPGLHASGIAERLGKRGGVTEHHLDVLVKQGYLTSLATPGFRRYFVTGRHAPAEMRALAALREGQNEKLLRIIRANPGIPLQTLALEAGVSVPYASRSVQRLAEEGLVEKVQVGKALTLHAGEA